MSVNFAVIEKIQISHNILHTYMYMYLAYKLLAVVSIALVRMSISSHILFICSSSTLSNSSSSPANAILQIGGDVKQDIYSKYILQCELTDKQYIYVKHMSSIMMANILILPIK